MIVDRALQQRAASGHPIRVGIVGAGFSARRIAYQLVSAVAGIRVCAIANRSLDHAMDACSFAGFDEVREASSGAELDERIRQGAVSVCGDPSVLCQSDLIDVLVESTGTVEFAARAATEAIAAGKHVVLVNVELDATLGPLLKRKADEAGVVFTDADGDEPGVAMNLVRLVRFMGLTPLVAGNLKGFYDRYRNPDTQQAVAAELNQKASSMTHFADGTKLSMELTVLANATGFGVGTEGPYGATLAHVMDSAEYFLDKVSDRGTVDFLLATPPSNGVFVVARDVDEMRRDYLKYLKLGDGPLYTFYRPFHLPQLEVPATIGRAAVFGDAAVAPLGAPVCDTVACAKRPLKQGEKLDGMGGYSCYGVIVNAATSLSQGLLPMGLSAGCKVRRDIGRDERIRYSDVELPSSLALSLRQQQDDMFRESILRSKESG